MCIQSNGCDSYYFLRSACAPLSFAGYRMQFLKEEVICLQQAFVFNCVVLPRFSDLAWVVVAHLENWSHCGVEKFTDDTTLLFLVLNDFIYLPYSKAWGEIML